MVKSNATAPIQSLDRGLQLLTAVWDAGRPLSLSELNSVLDIDRSSIFRLANTLAMRGYLAQIADSKAYTLGPTIWRFAGKIRQQSSLLMVAREHVSSLALSIRETVHLAVLQGGQVVFVDDELTDQVISVSSRTGRVEPVHCTALGKSLISDYDEKRLSQLLGRGRLKALTDRTITSISQLAKECERVAQKGFAVDNEEYHVGVRCIAAPIYDYSGRIVAAIGISSPAHRLPKSQFNAVGEKVKKEASQISDKLGHVE